MPENLGVKLVVLGLVLVILSRLAASLLVLGIKLVGVAFLIFGIYKIVKSFVVKS